MLDKLSKVYCLSIYIDNSRNKRRYVRYSVIEMLLYLVFMLLQIRFIQNVLNNKPVIWYSEYNQ